MLSLDDIALPRVATVQFAMTPETVESLLERIDGFVREAAEWGASVLVLPEYLCGCIAPGLTATSPKQTFENLADASHALLSGMVDIAAARNIWLIGGTLIERKEYQFFNSAPIIAPDGRHWLQRKIHLTPWERQSDLLTAGEEIFVIQTPFAKIATVICYDIEFPDLARAACEAGADILFNPSCTDNRHGFWRVRYSAHARCIENQVFAINAATVGWFPETTWLASNHGQAAILSPCDVAFARDGIIAQCEMNIPNQIICADLRMNALRQARSGGAVTPRQDRRQDFKVVTA